MSFSSPTYLIFFGIVLGIHYLSGVSWTKRKASLLLASYAFYAAWHLPFVLLLAGSTVIDWFVAGAMSRSNGKAARTAWLVVSLCVNLGMLGFFKYGGFITDNAVLLAGQLGLHIEPQPWSIILPVGISFFTFQTLSYTIDIYRRHTAPWHSFLDYALYVSFFPQLVAGPIVRSTDFLPQCVEPKRADGRRFGWGMCLIFIGLFQKVVIADAWCAPVVERVYDATGAPGLLSAWAGTLAFASQIFSDFAGYSICAIGSAMCLGFTLPDNFRSPYAAIGFSDFWQRWHITLSSWLRDYLYIPMGGNRIGPTRTGVNLMSTMLLGGLWHGAAWTFVAWGALHGGFLMIERILRGRFGHLAIFRTPIARLVLGMVTFVGVCIAWVFFRATSFDRAADVLFAMFGLGGVGDATASGEPLVRRLHVAQVAAVTGAIIASHWWMRRRSLEALYDRLPAWLIAAAMVVIVYLVLLMHGDDRAFIYFQF